MIDRNSGQQTQGTATTNPQNRRQANQITLLIAGNQGEQAIITVRKKTSQTPPTSHSLLEDVQLGAESVTEKRQEPISTLLYNHKLYVGAGNDDQSQIFLSSKMWRGAQERMPTHTTSRLKVCKVENIIFCISIERFGMIFWKNTVPGRRVFSWGNVKTKQ